MGGIVIKTVEKIFPERGNENGIEFKNLEILFTSTEKSPSRIGR